MTTPTIAERGVDSSNSHDTKGALIVVRDPLAGAAFAGNIVPASRINPNGRTYLNLLPEPNFFDVGLAVDTNARVPRRIQLALRLTF